MATETQIEAAISDNAAGPKKIMADGVMVDQHDIADQIKAVQYTKSQGASSKAHRGLRVSKLLPAGPG